MVDYATYALRAAAANPPYKLGFSLVASVPAPYTIGFALTTSLRRNIRDEKSIDSCKLIISVRRLYW